MKMLLNIIIVYKKIRISHPEMLIWLLIPIIGIFWVTSYFFKTTNSDVVAFNLDEKIVVPGKTVPSKFANIISRDFIWRKGGVVSFVFTGSYKSQYEIAFPLFSKRGLLASVAVPINAVGLPESMTWLNLRRLQISGWKIMSESRQQICDPQSLTNTDVVKNEVSESKKDLDELGLKTEIYIPPCGVVTPEVIKEINENYKGLITFGVSNNKIDDPNNRYLIARQVDNTVTIANVREWIKAVSTEKSWLILSFPDIGDSVDNNHISQSLLTQTLDEVLKSGVQLAQPEEILE